MKKFFVGILTVFCGNIAIAQPFGYAYVKTITVDALQVSGSSNLIDFPLLINITDINLRSVSNSGHINSEQGYDIVFTSDDCSVPLNFQIEKYDPASGQLVAWVNLPSLSYTTDTEIHLYYGNSSVSSSSSSTSTWSSNYEAVLHLNQDPSMVAPQMIDASGQNRSGTSRGSMLSSNLVNGIIGDAISFDEVDDCITITDFDYANTKSFAMSFWFNVNDNLGSSFQYLFSHGAWGTNHSLNTYIGEASLAFAPDQGMFKTVFQDDNDATSTDGYNAGTSYQDGNWHHYIFTVPEAGNPKVYIDGIERANVSFNGGQDYNPSTDIFLGAREDEEGTRFLGGTLDEFRLLNDMLTTDWILTEYRNQSSPGSFYTISAEAAAEIECTALPIDLFDFVVERTEFAKVAIRWITAIEKDNEYFEIERSQNGEKWETIKRVNGAGNSVSFQNYSEWDEHPLPSISYYRLKQIDYDGAFSYSSTRSVQIKQIEHLYVYPNPANTSLSLMVDAPDDLTATLQISNILGQVSSRHKVTLNKGYNNLTLPINELSDGTYFLIVNTQGGLRNNIRFIVQKE